MARITLAENVQIAGISISFQITREQGGVVGLGPETMSAGLSGQLTTRTDNDTGTFTVASGHGVTNSTANDYAVFWSGGKRFNMNATVTANTVTLDAGTGDNLPVVNTNCVLDQQVWYEMSFPGDDVSLAAARAAYRGMIDFRSDTTTSVLTLDVGLSGSSGEGWAWWDDGAVTNPFVNTNIAYVVVANGDTTTNGNEVRVGAQYDNTV